MYSLLRFTSDVQTLVSGARNAVSEWDSGTFTRPSGLDRSVCLQLFVEREETQVLPRDLRQDCSETRHHRRSQASRQHLGKSTQPDKLASNSHTHTKPAPAHFQELSKTEKGREFFFLTHVKSHSHNTRLLDGLNQNSPSQNLYRLFYCSATKINTIKRLKK